MEMKNKKVSMRYFQVYINIQRKSSKLSIEFENYLTLSRTVHISREVSAKILFHCHPILFIVQSIHNKNQFFLLKKLYFYQLVLRYNKNVLY